MRYFTVSGFLLHFLIISILIFEPRLLAEAFDMAKLKLELALRPILLQDPVEKPLNVTSENINQNIRSWLPLSGSFTPKTGLIQIGSTSFESLESASAALKDRDTMVISEGIYTDPIVIDADYVTIRGQGHVVMENTTFDGKAAIVVKGNHTTISNIECRKIEVKDGNGACIRLAGQHLNLFHVYFHHSQQGLLTGGNPGLVKIEDSRFEHLGFQGKAHGIYIGGGYLIITDSIFRAAKSEGHEIKSRAYSTHIERSLIASLSSDDSRLIDISNGGTLYIRHSVLEKGPGSKNSDLIGYSLEKLRHPINQVTLIDNIIILEREGTNILIKARGDLSPLIHNNVIIYNGPLAIDGINLIFKSREEAGIAPYPFLPGIPATR